MITFQRATRRRVKIKMLLKGPTGSGKTFGALHVADGLAPGKVVLLDSEHDRSEFYADVVPFDRAALDEHTPKAYAAHIRAAVDAGYEVVIVDSLSHCWMNVLDRKDAYDKANPRSNQWTNWGLFGGEWDDLMRTILEAPVHIICTARSKMAHEQVEQNGSKKVVKLGLAPQLRDNTEYEFAICFDVEQTTDKRHPAQVSKDNTNLLSEPGKVWDLADGAVPALIRKWMETAREVERPLPETQQAIDDALLELPESLQAKSRKRIAQYKQQGFPEAKAQEILAQLRALATPAAKAQSAEASSPTGAPANTDDRHAHEPEPAPAVAHDAAPAPPAKVSMSLSDAASYTVTVSGSVKPLGDLSTRALEKLLPLAQERRNAVLIDAITVVLHDRRRLEQAEPTRDVADALGDPSMEVAKRMRLRFRQSDYQLQTLPSRTLTASLARHDLGPELRAAINVVLRWREANPLHPDVQHVEATTGPDEVSEIDARLMGNTFGT